MEETTLAGVASMVTWFGVLGLVVAGLTLIALRVVNADEVPPFLRLRIRWWTAHHSAFLLVSLVVAVVGLAGLATT